MSPTPVLEAAPHLFALYILVTPLFYWLSKYSSSLRTDAHSPLSIPRVLVLLPVVSIFISGTLGLPATVLADSKPTLARNLVKASQLVSYVAYLFTNLTVTHLIFETRRRVAPYRLASYFYRAICYCLQFTNFVILSLISLYPRLLGSTDIAAVATLATTTVALSFAIVYRLVRGELNVKAGFIFFLPLLSLATFTILWLFSGAVARALRNVAVILHVLMTSTIAWPANIKIHADPSSRTDSDFAASSLRTLSIITTPSEDFLSLRDPFASPPPTPLIPLSPIKRAPLSPTHAFPRPGRQGDNPKRKHRGIRKPSMPRVLSSRKSCSSLASKRDIQILDDEDLDAEFLGQLLAYSLSHSQSAPALTKDSAVV